MFNIEWP